MILPHELILSIKRIKFPSVVYMSGTKGEGSFIGPIRTHVVVMLMGGSDTKASFINRAGIQGNRIAHNCRCRKKPRHRRRKVHNLLIFRIVQQAYLTFRSLVALAIYEAITIKKTIFVSYVFGLYGTTYLYVSLFDELRSTKHPPDKGNRMPCLISVQIEDTARSWPEFAERLAAAEEHVCSLQQ